jgi:two-component system invasion response regulator UvrY
MTGRPRVLLADDHPGVVKALSRVFSIDCDVVGVAADGNEAVEAAAQLQPVVTVVDLNLPSVDGLEVCRRILQANPRAKVILMTAVHDGGLTAEAAAAGASGFFGKVQAGHEMLDAIRAVWADMMRSA